MKKVVFFGNGPLAEYALAVLERECQVIFHAKCRADLEEVCRIKRNNPGAHGVLASFGVIIKPEILELFEPEGILNIHPSLLPLYRGASPIESAILDGGSDFAVSVMKLAKAMDAGPIYWQTTLTSAKIRKINETTDKDINEIPSKNEIYRALAETGAEWIVTHLENLPEPLPQDDAKATFCGKLDKKMSALTPETDTAEQTLRKIIAFQGYPKPKYTFFGTPCIILAAHILESDKTAPLTIPCADGGSVAVDKLQPEGRKAMDAGAFLNGYKR